MRKGDSEHLHAVLAENGSDLDKIKMAMNGVHFELRDLLDLLVFLDFCDPCML